PTSVTNEVFLFVPRQVRAQASSCLFAGKMHALLCRNWKQRVKGRDFYDFAWYLGCSIPLHLAHLQKRMEQMGHWTNEEDLTRETLRSLLRERFAQIDFDQARSDVLPFIRDADAVALWSKEFFVELVERLTVA
ncbi:MAG: nucleotidyl transferase AbiEii/AbiGii toxin family protein, partial [Verrucomicrobiota bacterium]